MMPDTTGRRRPSVEAQPPIMEWWRIVLMVVSVGAIVWWAHLIVTPTTAEPFGILGGAPAQRLAAPADAPMR